MKAESDQFGVIETGDGSKIRSFLEKPAADQVTGLADNPDEVLASMGNYVFSADALVELLHENSKVEGTGNDVGGDLIPMMVTSGEAHVYDFTENRVPGQEDRPHYWRDVGTIDSYFEAHMDLVDDFPAFDLYNDSWPIYNLGRTLPPAKIVNDGAHGASTVRRSLLSNGAVVSGATVVNSVLSPGARVEGGAVVENAVLLDDVVIGSGARVSNAVLDKNVKVPEGVQLGVEHRATADYTVSEAGVVVVPKGTIVPGTE